MGKGITLTQDELNTVSGTSYDASGRVELRTLGNGLQTSYDYFNWDDPAYVLQNGNTQGRLAKVQTGTTLDPDALQDLTYSDNPVGNVAGIANALAGPQSQTFTYDTVYRMTQGYTTGGLKPAIQPQYNIITRAASGWRCGKRKSCTTCSAITSAPPP